MIRALIKLRPKLKEPWWTVLKHCYWYGYWGLQGMRQFVMGGPAAMTIRYSERAVLAERICDFYPLETLLEVGCAYGQNFHIIAPLLPDVQMVGVDGDPKAVDSGKVLLAMKELKNVQLIAGEADDLEQFADKSFDLVICIACLLYVGPNKIERTINEMLRLARKAVLLVEQHEEKPLFPDQHLGSFVPHPASGSGYWIRDYRKLLEGIVPSDRIKINKIPKAIWTAEQWKKLGCLIEVACGDKQP